MMRNTLSILGFLLFGALLYRATIHPRAEAGKNEILFHVESRPAPTRDRFLITPILPVRFWVGYESGPRETNAPIGTLSCSPATKPVGQGPDGKARYDVLLDCGGAVYAIETIQFSK